jgi:drug/metabolite transporter (DMT)-like permease
LELHGQKQCLPVSRLLVFIPFPTNIGVDNLKTVRLAWDQWAGAAVLVVVLIAGRLWCSHNNRYGRVEEWVVETVKKQWRGVGAAVATMAGIGLGGYVGHRAGEGNRGYVITGMVVGSVAGFALAAAAWFCWMGARGERQDWAEYEQSNLRHDV